MRMTRVINLATDEVVTYALPPRAAVMNAYAQQTVKDFSWWDYARRYRNKLIVGHGTVGMGDWAALLDETQSMPNTKLREMLIDAIHVGEEVIGLLDGSIEMIDTAIDTPGTLPDEEVNDLIAKAQTQADRLREQGWDRGDFARELHALLEQVPSPPPLTREEEIADLLRKVHAESARLRAAGWTRADFARALHNMLAEQSASRAA